MLIAEGKVSPYASKVFLAKEIKKFKFRQNLTSWEQEL